MVNNVSRENAARYLVFAAIFIFILSTISAIWKMPWLPLNILLMTQFAIPSICLLVATSWRSAIKYALVCSLIHPLGTLLVNLFSATLIYVQAWDTESALRSISLTGASSAALWLLVLSIIIPTILVSCAVRYAHELYQTKRT